MTVVRRFLPAAVLVGLPAILYAPFLFGGKVLYWGVYQLQFYPWRQLAVEQIRAGHWPLWNPYLGAGTPLAANLQTAAFYPLNVLFLLMPVERAFGWELALHVALAGLFAYYLGQTLGLSRFGALIAGLAYGGGGYLVARWVFPTMVCTAAWLPLMLAFTEKLMSSIQYAISPTKGIRYRIRDIGLLGLVIALQLLAGHAQTSFYSLLIVAAFALFRLFQHQGASGKQQRTTGALLAACCLLLAALWGLALAAIQLLPTAELAAHSQRAGTLADLQFAYELSFWPWRLITLLAPDFFGNPARGGYWAYGTYWEEAAFVGVLPLLLAALAVGAWWRHRQEKEKGILTLIPFLALLAAVSVILALGDHTPIYPLLFRYVPGFGLFQAPARLMIGYALAVPLLAGIGADALQLTRRLQAALRFLVLAGLGMGIAGGGALLALPALNASFGQSTVRLGLTAALAAGVLLLRNQRRTRRRWQLAACCLLLVDLLAFGWGLAPGTNASAYQAPVATARFLQSQPPGRVYVAYPYAHEIYDRYVSRSGFGPSDLAYLQGLRESLLPNLNATYRLYGVGNYDPLTIGPYRDLWDRLKGGPGATPSLETIRPELDLFGVQYVLADEDLPLPLLYDTGPRIYRNDQALPEAYVAFQARVITGQAAQQAAVLDPAFDPRAEVLLGRPPVQPLPRGASLAETISQPEPSILRKAPDQVIIEVSMVKAGYLVLADTYYPGWRASVDGELAEILPANYAFRAVRLEPGEHTVLFEYAPLSFWFGAGITTTAVLSLAVGIIAGQWRGNLSLKTTGK